MRQSGFAVFAPPRTPRLLVKAFHTFRHRPVDDKPHVTFIDPHAKGNGSTNDWYFSTCPLLLHLGAFFRGQTGVVGFGVDAVIAEVLRNVRRVRTFVRVHNTAGALAILGFVCALKALRARNNMQ